MSTGPEDKTTDDATAPEGGEVETNGESGGEAEVDVAVDDGGNEGDGEGEQTVTEALEAKVATLEKEKQDTYERLLRTTADLDNLRKRSRREIEDARVDARSKVLRDMLPVMDNLERAIEHAEGADDASAQSIVEGVKLVIRQFGQGLEKNNVKPVEALGKPFDPNLHEAMSQVETAEAEPGSVVNVLQTGYLIGERLLRPALVVVAKAPPAEEPAAGSNGKSAVAAGEGESGEGDDSGTGEIGEVDDSKAEDSE